MLKKIRSVNPFTGEILGEFSLLSKRRADAEVLLSRRTFSSWGTLPAGERLDCVKRLAGQLRADKQKYAELMTVEMGKPIRESLAEVDKCAWLCDYYAENAAAYLRTEAVRTEASRSYVRFEPLGIVLAIMPWNFPFWQAFRFGIPAICAGNVILLKHASNVPMCALAIGKAFEKAGFPEHVFKTLLIDAKRAIRLIDEDRVDAVSLTGSNRAGAEVGAHAGAAIKKIVLELGGSDAFIVLDDADVEKAGRMAVSARMINSGQSCIAAKRFIVHENIAGTFRDIFTARLRELKIGDPMDVSTEVGPVARQDILLSLNEQLHDAEEKGGEIIRHRHVPEKGLFFAPSVVFQATKDMKVMNEEVFGPLAAVTVVKSDAEAISIANDSQFGLGASVWSGNIERAEGLAEKLQCGTVAINDMVKSDPRLPFGGVKKSGVGRELSHYGIREFVNIKSVVVHSL
ncbi:MAG TPA: NAD-dependent succinate-semialdehyde dehydrogenase [Dissulfurispiraceae bacterium]|nr:NAD-dependent succinate-semialdehyde dehydrogenase [Dissulfurispiraceae bacterium]